ncbi:MAG: GNAT family N-acetyltransferase, partial [Hyphomicrobiales bacterium]
MIPPTEQVRRFNRTVTRRIGVLDDRFLGRARPLAQSRLMFEVGLSGAEVRELRARLGLDSGYMSRLLRSLEADGLIETVAGAGDARMRRARLTARGRRELKELDRRSDVAALALLEPLRGTQRERLVAAMAEVERLLRAGEVDIAPEPAGSADAMRCLDAYIAEIARRFEQGYDPSRAQPAGPGDFAPPNGVFLIARLAGEPVGCGALKRTGEGIGDIKRVWVAEEARGLGIGQRMIEALEDCARKLGFRTLRLDTNKALTEA